MQLIILKWHLMLEDQLKPRCLGLGVVIVRGTEVQVGKKCLQSPALPVLRVPKVCCRPIPGLGKEGSTRTQRPARFLTV